MKFKVKGSVAAFMSIVLVVIVSAVLVLADLFQIMNVVSAGANCMAVAAFSADNLYNKEIFEDMDLILYTMSDEDLMDKVSEIVTSNEEGNKKRDMILSHAFSFEHSYLKDNPFWNFYGQLNNYTLEYTDGSNNIGRMLGSVVWDEDYEAPAYTSLYYDYEAIAGELECEVEGNLYDLLSERFYDGESINEDDYEKRFFTDVINWCEGTERISEDFEKAINDASLAGELCNIAAYGKDTENHETGFIWFNDADKTTYGDAYYTERLKNTIAYILDHYSCYLDGADTKSGLKDEIEYLIYGYQSDKENIAKVAYEILQQRIFANLNSILESDVAISETDDMSKDTVAVRWAVNEAYFDLQVLLHGGKLRWSKSVDDFYTSVGESITETWDSIDNVTDFTGYEDGDGYIDYLINQIYLSCFSDQIVCLETIYAHQLDMLQFAYGVDARECKYSSKITDSIGINPYSIDSAFSTMGKVVMSSYGKVISYKIGD